VALVLLLDVAFLSGMAPIVVIVALVVLVKAIAIRIQNVLQV